MAVEHKGFIIGKIGKNIIDMNYTEILSYEEQAIDLVVSIINMARDKLGHRQNLFQLANSRKEYIGRSKVNIGRLVNPIAMTCEKLIRDTIERNWHLTDTVMYKLRYMDSSTDECSVYYYFEAIFSQPTVKYPIPQATVSVFFRVEDRHIDDQDRVPLLVFKIEGHHSTHDVRFVDLSEHWLLEVLQTKTKFYKRIEELCMF